MAHAEGARGENRVCGTLRLVWALQQLHGWQIGCSKSTFIHPPLVNLNFTLPNIVHLLIQVKKLQWLILSKYRFLDPILLGEYPEEMEKILGTKLPRFSREDREKLKNGLDFIGINHYASYYARDCVSSVCEPGTGVSTTEGSYSKTAQKNGVPMGELVSILPPPRQKKINLEFFNILVVSEWAMRADPWPSVNERIWTCHFRPV